MKFSRWEVKFYETENGRCPARDFICNVQKKDQVFVDKALERLETYGANLKRPHVAPLRDGIWELRSDGMHGQYRLLYFFFAGDTIVITHGCRKKTQKVPDGEIDRAVKIREDYLTRFGRGREK
jgi:phage-related protein